MEKLNFADFDELAYCVVKKLENIKDEYPVISVYGKYETIKEVLESLIASGVKIGKSIELEDFDVAGYDKEFELSLIEDGVSVDKMWHEDNEYHKAGYYDTGANIALVHEDCNSKILSHIASDEMYEFAVGECECSECKCKDREVKPVVKEKYTINGKEVGKETYDKKSHEMDEIFNYVMNRMNDMFRRF